MTADKIQRICCRFQGLPLKPFNRELTSVPICPCGISRFGRISIPTVIGFNLKCLQVIPKGVQKATSSMIRTLFSGFGDNIASLYRISPRMLYSSGKIQFGVEGEYTTATSGSGYNEKAVPVNTYRVENMRILLSIYYHFYTSSFIG